MIDDELLNKFDRIQDLPVSEEMLGAYMEGNLDSNEYAQIDSMLSADSSISEFVDDISHDNIVNILDNLEHQLFDPSYPIFISNVQLPNPYNDVASPGFFQDEMAAACCLGDSIDTINDFPVNDLSADDLYMSENLSQDDSFIGSDQSLDIESHSGDDMFNEDSIDI